MSTGEQPGVAHKDEGVSGKVDSHIFAGVGVDGGERLGRFVAGFAGETLFLLWRNLRFGN